MSSIVNGLFSARAGISSHGTAIAVIGDNISNSSTTGYKTSRTEFADIIAGGQTAGKIVGSGSAVSAITGIFEQGTLENTGRELDLAIDGNGFFIVANGDQSFYTRAGNFKLDNEGFIVDQKGNRVQGYAANGSGALGDLNVSSVSQSNVATENVSISGNLDARDPVLAGGAAAIPASVDTGGNATYADLSAASAFQTVVDVFDSLGVSHTVTAYFFRTVAGNSNVNPAIDSEYEVRLYIDASESGAGGEEGVPYMIGKTTMKFDGNGTRTNAPSIVQSDISANVKWSGGAAPTDIDFSFTPFTMYSTSGGITSITGDGNGVGSISSLNIAKNGDIFALLDNGQSSIIGTVGLANFANSEGLIRVGSNYLQESIDSGAPIVGRAGSGTLGRVESGSLELSTVDIASEFVKLITVQRGFQANSRIITTINQLLNELINLV